MEMKTLLSCLFILFQTLIVFSLATEAETRHLRREKRTYPTMIWTSSPSVASSYLKYHQPMFWVYPTQSRDPTPRTQSQMHKSRWDLMTPTNSWQMHSPNWGYYYDTPTSPSNENLQNQITPSSVEPNDSMDQQVTTTDSPAIDRKNIDDYKPCEPYELKKPDFSAPNRRLSETKCYDYIWGIKYREEIEKRLEDCQRGQFHITVVSGRDTTPGEFPHMAAIGWKATTGDWIFKCGGSLVNPKFVLTAGHCTKATSLDTTIADRIPKIVRLGDKNILDSIDYDFLPTDVNITRIVRHPSYNPPNKYNDIALLELEKDVTFSKYVSPACLWTRHDVTSVGQKATVTGWGVVKSGNQDISPELQAADVDLIESTSCDSLLRPRCNRHWCGVHEDQICAGTLAGGADTCQGDSGGPLQVKISLPANTKTALHYVVGVTSFGFQCGLANTPGVYTRVSSYLDWIEDTVWSNNLN